MACEIVVCILNLECGAHQSSTNDCSDRFGDCFGDHFGGLLIDNG